MLDLNNKAIGRSYSSDIELEKYFCPSNPYIALATLALAISRCHTHSRSILGISHWIRPELFILEIVGQMLKP